MAECNVKVNTGFKATVYVPGAYLVVVVCITETDVSNDAVGVRIFDSLVTQDCYCDEAERKKRDNEARYVETEEKLTLIIEAHCARTWVAVDCTIVWIVDTRSKMLAKFMHSMKRVMSSKESHYSLIVFLIIINSYY